jgi:hypothetical protein
LFSPYQGVVQVLEMAEGRAVSVDGERWRVFLRQALAGARWGSLDSTAPFEQEIAYGLWTGRTGVRRLPVDPMLDPGVLQRSADALLQHLPVHSARVPFPQVDVLELWLLDGSEQAPLVLLTSVRPGQASPQVRRVDWVPARSDDAGFVAPGVGLNEPHAARNALAALIKREARATAAAQWFLRDEDGKGRGRSGVNLDPDAEGRVLPAAAFPPLLIRESWTAADDGQLVADYLDWLAPRLLLLDSLTPDVRARLEVAACRQPLEVYRYHRLYPAVLGQDRVKAALVEAMMRCAAE